MVESAIEAIDTAWGSWAWMRSGASSRRTRARRNAGGEVHLVGRREADEIVALARAPRQLAVRVRDEHRAVAARAQAQDGQEDLVLSSAPRAGGVDVE